MPIQNEIDPFSQVFTALWQLIDNCKPLNGYTEPGIGGAVHPPLLLPGNKIKFGLPEDRDPVKNNAQDADFPELILSTNGVAEANLNASSCGASIRRQYSWMITTGDFRTNYRLFPVQWAVFCAMGDYEASLAPLTYAGERFVKIMRVGGSVEGITEMKLNRNIRGWASVWSCTVDYMFSREMLRLFNEGVQ